MDIERTVAAEKIRAHDRAVVLNRRPTGLVRAHYGNWSIASAQQPAASVTIHDPEHPVALLTSRGGRTHNEHCATKHGIGPLDDHRPSLTEVDANGRPERYPARPIGHPAYYCRTASPLETLRFRGARRSLGLSWLLGRHCARGQQSGGRQTTQRTTPHL
jgi:hypothetical protein